MSEINGKEIRFVDESKDYYDLDYLEALFLDHSKQHEMDRDAGLRANYFNLPKALFTIVKHIQELQD